MPAVQWLSIELAVFLFYGNRQNGFYCLLCKKII